MGCILVGVAIIAGWRGRHPDVEIITTPVTTGVIARQVLAVATLEPAKTVNVGTQVSGTIQSLYVDFNTPVKAGQLVARLDPAPYQALLEQAKAELARANARAAELAALLEDATTKLERAQELAARDLIPREELETARVTMQELAADLNGSQAEILAAQAAVRRAQVDLSHTEIRTPLDGVVVHRHVNVGQTVAAALESPVLLTIADLRQMQLVAEIDEGEVGGVQPGTPVSFQVESLGEDAFEGRIADVRLQPYTQQVAGTAGPATASPAAAAAPRSARATPAGAAGTAPAPAASTGSDASGIVTYRAIIAVNNEDGRLLPGGTAIVHLTSGRRDEAVRIPNAALTFAPGAEILEALGQTESVLASSKPAIADTRDSPGRHARVWRHEDGRLVPVEIEIGISDSQWTELLDRAVQPGDELVTGAVVSERRR